MAPLDFKHFTSAKYRPGEDDAVNYYAQKRKKQYHGNEGKEVKELSMKPDKKLPNFKTPVKGKKGVSKFMRMKVHNQPYSSDYKKAMNASVQSADRKPEKYIKPDGKVGIRMVKTDKEVIKKEALVDPNDLKGRPKKADPNPESPYGIKHPLHPANLKKKKAKSEASSPSVLKPTKPSDITKHARTLAKSSDDYERNKKKYIDKARAKVFRMYPKESLNGLMKEELVDEAKGKPNDKLEINIPYGMTSDEKNRLNFAKFRIMKYSEPNSRGIQVNKWIGTRKNLQRMILDVMSKARAKKVFRFEGPPEARLFEEVDEALNLQQRMKRSRLMKRLKTRIKIGRERAQRKMANKKTLEKRAMRQARQQIAKKLTRGIPKGELSFARKQEIEKRLEKPALQQRIKRIAKRIFKDVRKKEVQRKKG